MSLPLPPPAGFCHQCGRPLPPAAQFCPSCGTPQYAPGVAFAPVGGGYVPGAAPPSPPKQGLGIVWIVVIVVLVVVAFSGLSAYLLYFEVSGLTRGPVSVPLGTAFAMFSGQATNCTSASAAAHACVTPSDFAYQVSVAASMIWLDDVAFSIATASGAIFHNVGAAEIAVVTTTGQVVAYSSMAAGVGIAMTGSWANYGVGFSPSAPLSNSYLIVIDMGQTASTLGQSLHVVAAGLNGYSGTESTSLP